MGPYTTAKLLLDSTGSPVIMSGTDQEEDVTLVSAIRHPVTGRITYFPDNSSYAPASLLPMSIRLGVNSPVPQMPSAVWTTGSPTGMTSFDLLMNSDGTPILNTTLPARLVNMVNSNALIDTTYWTLKNATNGLATPSPLVTEFTVNTDKLVIELNPTVNNGLTAPGALEIWVNDVPLSIIGIPEASAVSPQILTLTWATKAKRKITLSTSLVSQHTFWVSSGDTMTPTTAPSLIKLLVHGDSWVEGALSVGLPFARLLPRYLGIDEIPVTGQGGTGYVNAGPSGQGKSVYGSEDRLSAIVRHAPTDLLIFGGINDNNSNPIEIQEAVTAALSYIATNLPTTRIHIVLPQSTSATADVAANYLANIAAVQAAIASATNVTSVTDTRGWFTGTGCSTSRKGDGNRDIFLGYDSVHPTQAGHDYIARKLAEILQRWIYV